MRFRGHLRHSAPAMRHSVRRLLYNLVWLTQERYTVPDNIQFDDMRALARVISRREHHSYPGSALHLGNPAVTAELIPPIMYRLGIDVTTIEPTLLLDGLPPNERCGFILQLALGTSS